MSETSLRLVLPPQLQGLLSSPCVCCAGGGGGGGDWQIAAWEGCQFGRTRVRTPDISKPTGACYSKEREGRVDELVI